MRSLATELFWIPVLLLLLSGGCINTLAQSNQCDYPDPPGGTLTCEEGQIPACMTKDGKAIGVCRTPPPSIGTSNERDRHSLDNVNSPVDQFLAAYSEFIGWSFEMPDYEIELTARDSIRRYPEFPSNDALGRILLDNGKYAEAEAEFRRYLLWLQNNKEPVFQQTMWVVYDELGMSLYRQGKFAEAEDAFKKSIEGVTHDGGVSRQLDDAFQYHLAMTLAARRKYLEAEATLRDLIQRKPQYPQSHTFLGDILLEQGKLAEAEAEFRRGLSDMQTVGEACRRLFTLLFKQGRYADAEAITGEIIRTQNNSLSSLKNGLSLLNERKYKEAFIQFRYAIDNDPTNIAAKEALEKVKAIMMQSGSK